MSSTILRDFHPSDRNALVQVMVQLVPDYFDSSEIADFEAYLLEAAQHYSVIEVAGKVVGGGGINYGFDAGQTARISWDLIHPDYQGQGFGKQLVILRLQQIRKQPQVTGVVVRTSQMAYRFYQKMGFELAQYVPDFWARGYDLYEMVHDLK